MNPLIFTSLQPCLVLPDRSVANLLKRLVVPLRVAAALCCLQSATGAPYPPGGAPVRWVQPDGAVVNLRILGDEFYARTETEDGYTVIYHEADRAYYYAVKGGDGVSLVASGTRAGGAVPKELARHLKEAAPVVAGIREGNIEKFAPDREAKWKARVNAVNALRAAKLANPPGSPAPGDILAAPVSGAKVGLMILVQFPDDPAIPGQDAVNFPTSKQKIERYANSTDYTEDGNTGSIRDYFYDQSNGQLTHTQVVTPIATLSHPRAYYNYADYPTNLELRDAGSAGREMVADAITKLKTEGFVFPDLSTDPANRVMATSLLFAGEDSGVWAKGLWPHASGVGGMGINIGTAGSPKYVSSYQCTNVPDAAPAIGTVCHELGHLLLGYPDLYDTDSSDGNSAGLGFHCLMAAGNHVNQRRSPAPINLYLKDYSGWATITDLTPTQSLDAIVPSTGNYGYRIKKAGSNKEYFLVENRGTGDKWAAYCPDRGIAIWHIDENVVTGNMRQQMLGGSHYLVSLEQADGLFDLEANADWGDSDDMYDAGSSPFSNGTVPNANWWAGTSSGISITVLDSPGPSMTVRFGGSVGTTTLTTDPSSRNVEGTGGVFVFNVGSNSSWSWTKSESWITSSEASPQTGNQEFTYAVAANNSGLSRTATITLTSGTSVAVHTIIQSAMIPDDHGDSIGNATVVGQNSITDGVIETPGDWDYFRINVTGTGFLSARSTGYLDTVGWLLDSSGNLLKEDDDSGGGGGFLINHEVTAGTYYVRVRHYHDGEGTGAYGLNISFSATALLTLEPAELLIPAASSSHVFEVSSNTNWSWNCSADWISSNELASQSGNQTFTYSVGANPDPATRTATLYVTAGGITRTHVVTQSAAPADDHGDTRATATVVTANSTTGGNLETEGDEDYFRIDLATGGLLSVQTTGNMDTRGMLFDSQGVLLQEDDDKGTDVNFRLAASLPAGTYFIGVRHYDGYGTGAYQLVSEFSAGNGLLVDIPAATAPAAGGFMDFGVISNVSWHWSSNVPWLTSDVTNPQSGSQVFGFTVSANSGQTGRTGTITLTSGALVATHVVTQSGALPGEFDNVLIRNLGSRGISTWYTSGTSQLAEARLTIDGQPLEDAFDHVGTPSLEVRPYIGSETITNVWKNYSIPAQTGTFFASFTTTPSSGTMDTTVGFSSAAADFWDDLAAYVRFGPTGVVDARNGGGFGAVAPLVYTAGKTYFVRMEVNLAAKRYWATVTPEGGLPVVIASNYSFRTEQAGVTQLSNFACLAYTGGTQPVGDLNLSQTSGVTANNVWGNRPISSQGGKFHASFTTIPSSSSVDTVIGFCGSTADFWDDIAACVRFAPTGKVDARNYAGFFAETDMNYTAGVSYFVQMEVDVGAKRYRVTVTPAGGSPVVIANNYFFRVEQFQVPRLACFSYLTWTGGTQSISGLTVSGGQAGLPALSGPAITGPMSASSTAADILLTKELKLVPNSHATDETTTLQNTSASSRQIRLRLNDDYGSDSATNIHYTSSGDAVVSPADHWFISTDSNYPYIPRDPALMISWSLSSNLPSASVTRAPGAGEDKFELELVTTLAPGQVSKVTVRRELFESAEVALGQGQPLGGENAYLADLTLGGGSLSPAFMAHWTAYGSLVSAGSSSVAITPVVSMSGATVKVNGGTVASGSPSAGIPLNAGANTILVVVTAPNGITTRTYTLQVTRGGIQAWRQTWFGTKLNAGSAANNFDADRDGLVNLVEYALGLNPLQASPGQLPYGAWSGGNFQISFATPPDVTGIIYGAEWSTTLQPGDWHPVTDAGPAGTHLFSIPSAGTPQKFIRLKVSSEE